MFFKTVSFDFYHISDDSIAGIILFIGLILYVILTVCYIILGFKKVKEWHGRMSIIAVIISAAMGFAGSLVVLYGSELLNGLIHCSSARMRIHSSLLICCINLRIFLNIFTLPAERQELTEHDFC